MDKLQTLKTLEGPAGLVISILLLPWTHFDKLEDIPSKFKYYPLLSQSIGLTRPKLSQTRKWSQFQLATAILCNLVGVKNIIISTLKESEYDEWHYLLGDTGLNLGSYGGMFNLVSGYSFCLFGIEMLANWWAWNTTGDWFYCWDQVLVERAPGAVTLDRHQVQLWKGVYMIYILGIYFCWVTLCTCNVQCMYSIFFHMPEMSLKYVSVAIVNAVIWAAAMYLIGWFCTLSTSAFCSQFYQYIVRFNQTNQTIRSISDKSVKNNGRLSSSHYVVLLGQLNAYEMTRSEFQYLSPVWSVIHGILVLGSSFGVCFWIFMAVYLSVNPLICAVALACAGCVTTYMAVCCVFPAIVAYQSQDCLTRFHSLLAREVHILMPSDDTASSRLRRQLRSCLPFGIKHRIARLVAFHTSAELSIKSGALFSVNYHECLKYLFELVGYYLMFVKTMGVPTDLEISSIFSP